MNYTTNFNLNKPEGTDLYNHLTIDNPNMDIIDAAMQANKLASIGAATELISGNIHAITRADSNQNVFKFKATGNFNAGDTITVDGVTVNAYTTAGQQLVNNAYVLSAEVLCILDGTSLWVLTNKNFNINTTEVSYTFEPGISHSYEGIHTNIPTAKIISVETIYNEDLFYLVHNDNLAGFEISLYENGDVLALIAPNSKSFSEVTANRTIRFKITYID